MSALESSDLVVIPSSSRRREAQPSPLTKPLSTSQNSRFLLGLDGLEVAEVVCVAKGNCGLGVSPEVKVVVAESRAVVNGAIDRGDVVYGLNTHLGFRRNEVIPAEDLWLYQDFVISTHTAGVGKPLSAVEARAVLLARVTGMAKGGSGVSPAVFDLLVSLLDRNVLPDIPSVGSVGAADLTQLAAIAEVVAGRGTATVGAQRLPGKEALAAVGLSPAALEPKDALAIISSNAVSIGLGALAVEEVSDVAALATKAAALSVEAVSGNMSPFGEAVAANKAFEGQQRVARELRRLLANSRLHQSSTRRNVQDAISLRTVPQVHGALFDHLDVTRRAVKIELNSPSDNPVVVIEDQELVSNGNFSPTTMAISFESLRIAIAHVGILSERRLHKLLLVRQGYQSGAKVGPRGRVPNLIVNAAASLLAEIKHAAAPVTLASTSLNVDVEDHASLLPQAVVATRRSVELLEQMLAIELLLATDTLSFLDAGVVLGDGTSTVRELVESVLARHISGSTANLLADLVVTLKAEQ